MILHIVLLVLFVWGVVDILSGMGILLRVLLVPLAWMFGQSKPPAFVHNRYFRGKTPPPPPKPEVDEDGIPYL